VLFKQTATTSEQDLVPLQEWRLPQIADWTLKLEKIPSTSGYVVPDKTVTFESIRLYRYFNGLQLLAFTVKPECGESMIMEDWLHFTRLARQLYPTFTEQTKEGKVSPLVLITPTDRVDFGFNQGQLEIPSTTHLGKHFSTIIKFLTSQFFREKNTINTWLEQNIALYDDRMFISVAYGLPKDTLYIKQIEALVAYTDRGVDAWMKDGYAYDKTYIENDLQDKRLTLWESNGSIYFYTDMVNAYLGRANIQDPNDFFIKKLAAKDIPNKYARMLIQALFYQASLRYYDQTITSSTTQLLKHQQTDAIKKQYEQFIQFTNQYWFSDLTQQMQGKAIGRLQQQGLALKAHYERILDELERTSDFLQARQELELTKTSKNLTQYGVIFAVLAIYYALIPILKDWREAIGLDGSKNSLWLWKTWQTEFIPSWGQDWLLGLIILGVIPTLLAFIAYKIIDRHER
jgi:hypothetical protein